MWVERFLCCKKEKLKFMVSAMRDTDENFSQPRKKKKILSFFFFVSPPVLVMHWTLLDTIGKEKKKNFEKFLRRKNSSKKEKKKRRRKGFIHEILVLVGCDVLFVSPLLSPEVRFLVGFVSLLDVLISTFPISFLSLVAKL